MFQFYWVPLGTIATLAPTDKYLNLIVKYKI